MQRLERMLIGWCEALVKHTMVQTAWASVDSRPMVTRMVGHNPLLVALD
jgi:transcription antitermination factor NusG